MLESGRRSAGAWRIRAPEVEIAVGTDGRVTIRRIDERGPSRRIVSEAMILANAEAAAFCIRNEIPAIYRRQSAAVLAVASPEEPARDAPDAGYDPVAVRALRRGLRRGETGLSPAPHQGLGLQAYTQMTSPIRRFMDLVIQRQIVATLQGLPVPYDAEMLARIAATAEESERNAREAERGIDEYWILKHYASRPGEEVSGVVVSVEPRRTVIELEDTLYAASLARRPDHRLGDRLRLAIEASRPRASRLTLRELP
jgi:exoribonuclease-2